MHLYLHVPFCARRCSYCDFAIAVRREIPARVFTTAVLREWSSRLGEAPWRDLARIDTLYFGGGTPSRLPAESVALLLQRFAQDRELAPGAEVTLEANPDDVTGPLAEAWRQAGINRISLGAQSFAPRVLEWMHRTHGPAQIERAVRLLRASGFDNLSLDLIYALPEQLTRSWRDDLEQALALGPEHLSFYALTVEQHTPLGRWTARGETIPLPDDRAAEEFLVARELLDVAGFEHYEVSNAARPGFRSRHNSAYWQRGPFLGLGPSAHSGFAATRSWNVREWEEYRRRSESGQDPRADEEHLTAEQVALEERYLGLRTREGVAAAKLAARVRENWSAEGWGEESDGRVRLTAQGWLRLDALVASLTDC